MFTCNYNIKPFLKNKVKLMSRHVFCKIFIPITEIKFYQSYFTFIKAQALSNTVLFQTYSSFQKPEVHPK